MCVLLIGWRLQDHPHLVVAANRDEDRERPSHPPQESRVGQRRALFPVDAVAGGTWLGVNDAGVAVAVTNRAGADFDALRPSRGRLTLEALGSASAAEARRRLEQRVAGQAHNGFNLFCGDAGAAWVARWDGRLHIVDLEPGAYVLTNTHDLDVLRVPEFAVLPWGRLAAPALQRLLQELLGDHEIRDEAGTALCKHGERYGTVSAAVFVPRPQGGWDMDFAAGNPCTTPFVRYSLDVDATPPRPASPGGV